MGSSAGPGADAAPANESRPHIILVGLPGAGKSSCGVLLADRLGRPFVDLDAEIERAAGTTISEIFATRGEAHFRDLESAETRRLLSRPPSVVSPGGGWVEREENLAAVRQVARVVYLRVTPREASRRLGEQVAQRPLLAGGDPEGRIAALLERRARHYDSANLILDTEVLSVEEVVTVLRELVLTGGASLG